MSATTYDQGTLAFYERRGQEFCQATMSLDLHELYEPFLKELPLGAHILDAGCGSGRDTKAFLERGYRVTAIDASPQMASLATEHTGQSCQVLSFQELDFREEFDGIWACASLLHVPKTEMDDVLRRLAGALKVGGVLYTSLKEGYGERIAEDGRFFSYYSRESFKELLNTHPILDEIAFWKTEDTRSREHIGPWLNFLLKRRRS
ncbi:MAG: SAM-dependent methyltransferase [Blastocatellia bacterium AA13]|nr:MAG: SAM-dependent methyltransferase [Blastocatellia bacterium AA13]